MFWVLSYWVDPIKPASSVGLHAHRFVHMTNPTMLQERGSDKKHKSMEENLNKIFRLPATMLEKTA
jgi:hypothetical protein